MGAFILYTEISSRLLARFTKKLVAQERFNDVDRFVNKGVLRPYPNCKSRASFPPNKGNFSWDGGILVTIGANAFY